VRLGPNAFSALVFDSRGADGDRSAVPFGDLGWVFGRLPRTSSGATICRPYGTLSRGPPYQVRGATGQPRTEFSEDSLSGCCWVLTGMRSPSTWLRAGSRLRVTALRTLMLRSG